MSNIASFKKRKQELLYYLELAQDYKARTIRFASNLEGLYYSKEISYAEFKYKLARAIKGKTYREWVDYYDTLIQNSNDELIKVDEELRNTEATSKNNIALLITLINVLFILFALRNS